MKKGKATVKNERGIHARPSGEIAKEALKYKSKISINFQGKTANAKDVIQLIILEMLKGAVVEIVAEGEDEEAAFNAIKELIEKEYIFD
ncbi:MAG TPA: HPr family phosphocarrier protein [Spirochaetota bacterium]|nr:HPr family phosphocarrier protein [Spirochaetota bacterium]HOL57325.1 HPr family phosphocarrier protein [Spirochaetota bacterium]HPP04890.1 HPr family phosphocarrier protein [Spirochaetota bacterium]